VGSQFICRDFLFPLTAEEHNLVPLNDPGNVAYIHDQLVHADPPDNRSAPAPDQYFTFI
jgi:hypothetical protein